MLKKNLRLLGPVSKKSKVLFAPEFDIKYEENGSEKNKFGFIVSKKIDKRAVVRNRIKRIVRKAVEENLSSIKTGHNFLFILKINAVEKEKKEIEKRLIALLKENNLYA